MSDCFDHAGDAFDSMSPGGRDYEEGYRFNYNPLYYHTKITYSEIQAETEKAIRIVIDHSDEISVAMWIPKALIKERKKTTMYVLRTFYVVELGKALLAHSPFED